MLLRQFLDDDLGCASYLIADESSGEAALIDPAYRIEPFLAEADRLGVRVTRVLETHTHADHVSGHGRLALEHGAVVSVQTAAEVEYPHEPLADGDEVAVGSLRVRVLHTPGHRPEHCCFVARDGSRSRARQSPALRERRPAACEVLFTGDSLFVGSVARPDLAVEAREGAEGLFYSLRRLLELRDDVQVLPGHIAGSLCGGSMRADPSSTIGFERRFNPLLAITAVHEFVEASAADTAIPRPPNMERIVELNRGPFLAARPPVGPIGATRASTVLDVRPSESFCAGHVRGALSVPVAQSRFGTKAGFVLRPGERVTLHASSNEEAELAARRLHAVGFLDLEGYLAEPEATETIEPVGIDELEELLAAGAVELIDVREVSERDSGYIAGSRHVPYRLLRAAGREAADGKPVVTICESGARAGIAASLLAAAGVEARPVLGAGIADLQRRGRPTIEFRRCAP